MVPAANIRIKYGMPTFEMNSGWVAVANQKNYVSLYTCSPDHIAPYREKHPDAKPARRALTSGTLTI